MFEKIEKWRNKETGKNMYRYIPYNTPMLPVENSELIETVYFHNDPEKQKEYERKEKLK